MAHVSSTRLSIWSSTTLASSCTISRVHNHLRVRFSRSRYLTGQIQINSERPRLRALLAVVVELRWLLPRCTLHTFVPVQFSCWLLGHEGCKTMTEGRVHAL